MVWWQDEASGKGLGVGFVEGYNAVEATLLGRSPAAMDAALQASGSGPLTLPPPAPEATTPKPL